MTADDGAQELRRLAENIGRIAGKAVTDVDGVVQKGAANVKEDLRAGVRSSRHFSSKKRSGLEQSITYDSNYTPGVVRYDVGPDKARRGGALGNIYYFGTSRGGGSGDLDGPLARETPKMQSALEALTERWAGQL